MVIIPTMNSKALVKLLEQQGWTLRASKGSHHIFVHPTKGGHISVPHPKSDLENLTRGRAGSQIAEASWSEMKEPL